MATTAAEASAGQVTPKLIFGRFRFWLFMVGLVVILTGLLFGYDQGSSSARCSSSPRTSISAPPCRRW